MGDTVMLEQHNKDHTSLTKLFIEFPKIEDPYEKLGISDLSKFDEVYKRSNCEALAVTRYNGKPSLHFVLFDPTIIVNGKARTVLTFDYMYDADSESFGLMTLYPTMSMNHNTDNSTYFRGLFNVGGKEITLEIPTIVSFSDMTDRLMSENQISFDSSLAMASGSSERS